MIYTVGAIFLAISSLLTWIYGLIQHNNTLKYQLAQKDAASEIGKFTDQINNLNNTVKEDVRDYEAAKNKFNSSNPGSGAV